MPIDLPALDVWRLAEQGLLVAHQAWHDRLCSRSREWTTELELMTELRLRQRTAHELFVMAMQEVRQAAAARRHEPLSRVRHRPIG